MSKVVNSPYAVQMTRKGDNKVEVLVVSSTLHKNNENLQALVKAGFEVSSTLARTKGGLTFGGNAQFYLYVTGTDAQAKALDSETYKKLQGGESSPVKEAVKVVEKEQPVIQAAVPDEKVVLQGEEAKAEAEKPSEKPATQARTSRKTKETTK